MPGTGVEMPFRLNLATACKTCTGLAALICIMLLLQPVTGYRPIDSAGLTMVQVVHLNRGL